MRHPDTFPRALFVGSIVVAIFAYGMITGGFGLFPYKLLSSAQHVATDLTRHYKSYLRIEPSRYLHEANGVDSGVTINNTAAAMPELTLMSGLFDGKAGFQLIDMNGRVVHRWNVSYKDIFPKPVHLADYVVPRSDWDSEIQGAVALPDGSIVFNFHNYTFKGLVKLDRCGAVVWMLPRETHHSVDVADDGSFWVPARILRKENDKTLPYMQPPFREETALHVSSTGKVIREISLSRLLIERGYEGALLPTGAEKVSPGSNPMHLNDVDVLGRDEASAFPMFEAGDLMVSMRDLNLIVVFNPDSGQIKWHQTGPWLRQHDPDFGPDGRIVVFNNRSGYENRPSFGGSEIMAIDPESRKTDVIYAGNDDRLFFSHQLGAQQILQNGNILITSSEQGWVFEVDRKGTIVWEYVDRYDENRVATVFEAKRYKYDYFGVADWSCD